MQTQLSRQQPSTWTLDPQKAKTIALVYAIYLFIPWPWDWIPILGDAVDVITFFIAYSSLKGAGVPLGNTPRVHDEPRTLDVHRRDLPQ